MHPKNSEIRIDPSDQENIVDRIECQAGKTRPALLDYRYQRACWFAGGVNKLPEDGAWGAKIGEYDQILIRCCVVGHTRGHRRAGIDVGDLKRIRQRHAAAIQESALEVVVQLIWPGRCIIASECVDPAFTLWGV